MYLGNLTEGLYDSEGGPVDPNSKGVEGNTWINTSSPPIVNGVLAAALLGDEKAVRDGRIALKDITAGNNASSNR